MCKMLPVQHIQMDLQSTQLPKTYVTPKTKLKQISQLHLPLNMTNSTATVPHSTQDVHKLIGEKTKF